MSSSDFTCRQCGERLGHVKPSKVLHLDVDAGRLVFVDNVNGNCTIRCTACGATITFRGGRIDLSDERKSA